MSDPSPIHADRTPFRRMLALAAMVSTLVSGCSLSRAETPTETSTPSSSANKTRPLHTVVDTYTTVFETHTVTVTRPADKATLDPKAGSPSKGIVSHKIVGPKNSGVGGEIDISNATHSLFVQLSNSKGPLKTALLLTGKENVAINRNSQGTYTTFVPCSDLKPKNGKIDVQIGFQKLNPDTHKAEHELLDVLVPVELAKDGSCTFGAF